ncbi:hypothetical protein NR798_29135 [Archangium gephyra]|uniref:hypothetical protein n=1 Tax=Archangium gephyra TaxID=48 RepID=UPI0035D4566C
MTKNERLIFDLRSQITRAANQYTVNRDLVAAIIYDELTRRDWKDDAQDIEAGAFLMAQGVTKGVHLLALTAMRIEDQSFGISQMNVGTVYELVAAGLIPTPNGWTYNKLDQTLLLLLNKEMAPTLVAARLRQTIDYWKNWKKGGVDISNRPEILGTLYSKGLTGDNGVNPNPQPNARGLEIVKTMSAMKWIFKARSPDDF